MKLLRNLILVCLISVSVLILIDQWIVFSARGEIISNASNLPIADVILVPGAQVYAGEVSGILAQRLDAAIDAFNAKKSDKILVSGDYSSRYYDEASAMQKYLLKHGISSGSILLDHAGFSTYDSVLRAKTIFGAHSVIIVSQDFHLPRALFIARSLGLQAVGFSASKVPLSAKQSLRSEWREPLARLKAVYDVLRKAQPAFTGSGLPIDKLGNVSPH